MVRLLDRSEGHRFRTWRISIRSDHALRQYHEAVPPGVHHTGIGEHFQQGGSVFHAGPTRLHHGPQHAHDVGAGRLALRRLRHLSEHGEHGAFHGFAHGPIRRISGFAQNGRHVERAVVVQERQGLHRSANDLRKYDSAVTAGSHQGGVRDEIAQLGAGEVLRGPGNVVHDASHGEQEVRAGIPVGHRIHVQVVHHLLPGFQGTVPSGDHEPSARHRHRGNARSQPALPARGCVSPLPGGQWLS